MLQDLKKGEPNQKMAGAPQYNFDVGYAYWSGQPYDLCSLAGDGFQYGVAAKAKNSFMGYDINEILKRVKWIKED